MRAVEVLTTIFNFFRLIFSLPGIVASFYLKRRRAVKRFREEMIACGVPPEEAEELSKMYSFGIRDIMRLAQGASET